MTTLQDIQSDLQQISYILSDCRHLTLDSYYMLVTDTNEKFTTIHHDKFLVRVRESFWKLAIIELTKLYGSSIQTDNFSIIVLIKLLKRQHATSQWKDLITAQELKDIDNTFSTQEIKMLILKLVELRNQHYAHKDRKPNNNIYDVKFYLTDCFTLIEKAETTVKMLSERFGCKIEISNYKGEQMNDFIEKLIESRTLAGMYKMQSGLR